MNPRNCWQRHGFLYVRGQVWRISLILPGRKDDDYYYYFKLSKWKDCFVICKKAAINFYYSFILVVSLEKDL